MKTVKFGGLNARLLGGSDGNGGGDGPLIVLCHGYGAPGDDLVSIGDALLEIPELSEPSSGGKAAAPRFLFPHALLAMPPEYGNGRCWWPLDMMKVQMAMMSGRHRDLASEVPEGLAAARDALTACLDEAQRTLGVTGERTVIGGFSQGAMLTCDLALRSDRKLAGLVQLSGTLLAEAEWRPRFASRRGTPVFVSHGNADPVLPFTQAEVLRDLFTEAGLGVRWVPFRGGHGIGPEAMVGLATFLRDVLVSS